MSSYKSYFREEEAPYFELSYPALSYSVVVAIKPNPTVLLLFKKSGISVLIEPVTLWVPKVRLPLAEIPFPNKIKKQLYNKFKNSGLTLPNSIIAYDDIDITELNSLVTKNNMNIISDIV